MNATPREPFDAEEARVKRAYDALPHGEPSAALDARILAHARAAANHAPKRRRPWFLGAGLGTAAAAVFAAGIAWQLGVFEGDRALSTTPVETPAVEEELDRIDIEFMKQERKKDEAPARVSPSLRPPPAPPLPPPPPPPAAPPAVLGDAAPAPVVQDAAARAESAAGRVGERQREQAATSAPQAGPPGAPPLDSRIRGNDEPRAQAAQEVAQPFPAEAAPMPEPAATGEGESVREDKARDDFADAPVQSAPASADESRDNAALGAAASNTATPELARRAAGLAKEAALPPWAEDVRLAPDEWLERIRDRVQHGDRQGAEHSLRRFVLEHPQRRVPRDLQRLLVE